MNSNGDTPLHEAVRGGYSAATELLIAAGAFVRAVNKNGKTPPQLAFELERNYHDVAEFLRDAEATGAR